MINRDPSSGVGKLRTHIYLIDGSDCMAEEPIQEIQKLIELEDEIQKTRWMTKFSSLSGINELIRLIRE